MRMSNMDRTRLWAVGALAGFVGVASTGMAQIRTATIPSGTVRGPIVRPTQPTRPPSVQPPIARPPGHHHPHRPHYPGYPIYWGPVWYHQYWYDSYSGYYYDDQLDAREAARRRNAALQASYNAGLAYGVAETTEAPPPPDPAEVAMQAGNYAEAAVIYGERLADAVSDEPAADEDATDDESAEAPATPVRDLARLYAVALIGDGQFDEAETALAAAYGADDELMKRPLRMTGLLTKRELRRLVRLAVNRAHATETYDAWFSVAMLMQSEGRHALAADMLERAEAAADAPVSTSETLASQIAALETLQAQSDDAVATELQPLIDNLRAALDAADEG